VASIDLEPRTVGISLAFGQTRQATAPTAKTCKGTTATVKTYTYGTTNNQLVDISPTGNICAGVWNRNSGGGIANYTICNFPNPLPSTSGQPYGTAYITASAAAVTSDPVPVFVHAPVTAVSLVGPQQCFSQGELTTLDAQACYSTTVNNQPANVLLCAPATVTNPAQFACPLPAGASLASIPDCTAAIGTLTYSVGNPTVASINQLTNQITAELPGTTVITASVAGSGSSAGYFSTCPPKSISVKLANGNTVGTITQGVTQNLVTTVTDTNNQVITGLSLDYQSTDPIDISAIATGAVTTSFPGVASIYAVCQPTSCNPSPINQVGLYGTGLSITSNPVTITTPGTASDYMWFGAPGQSQYVVPVELLTGTTGSTVKLPYVPNSMVMDRLGNNLYLGSSHGLMIYSASSNSVTKTDPSVPGVVLAVSPNNQILLINDQRRQIFYLYPVSGAGTTAFGGMGNAAAWTPDAKTLYVSDSAELNNLPANIAAGTTTHTDTLYVNNVNTGWTTYPLAPSGAQNPGAQSLALTIPGVGAFLSGNPTVANTWCPSGNTGDYASMIFYPQVDSVPTPTDVLAATTDGAHILGAAYANGAVTLSDIPVTVPSGECPPPESNGTLLPLPIPFTTPVQQTLNVQATGVNQVIASPASNLAFVLYSGSTTGATLPYYIPGAAGGPGYVPLTGSAVTAPVAGAFTPDDTLFFVSTAGDNQIHYISVPMILTDPAHADTQQIAPNLPACTPATTDLDCVGAPAGATVVPATVITVRPRSTT
jgi:hypothetical protein